MTLPGPILTNRDSKILIDIYRYRYLSISQIKELYFPSLQTTYRRLRALSKLGMLKGYRAPSIPDSIYYLDSKGAEVVAQALQVTVEDLGWHRTSRAPKDYYFLQHFLEVNDFRIALTLGCPRVGLSLVGFIPEYLTEKTPQGELKKYIKDIVCNINNQEEAISHTPDAVFALGKNQSAALFFLEVDRGTEVISDEYKGVLKMFKFYLNYLTSGSYQRYQTDFNCNSFRLFRTLFVTTSATRIANIREVVSNFPFPFAEKAKKLIWLTEQKNINPTTIFQEIWQTADAEDNNRYRIG